jgi:hypothetical protein
MHFGHEVRLHDEGPGRRWLADDGMHFGQLTLILDIGQRNHRKITERDPSGMSIEVTFPIDDGP